MKLIKCFVYTPFYYFMVLDKSGFLGQDKKQIFFNSMDTEYTLHTPLWNILKGKLNKSEYNEVKRMLGCRQIEENDVIFYYF